MSKYMEKNSGDKGSPESIIGNFKFDKNSVVLACGDTLNSFGLDLTNPEIIKFEENGIEFEVIGGVNDTSLTQLKVTLQIQKKLNISPVEVYRGQSIDLFNDGQLDYVIRQASERTKIESTKLKESLYALAQKLEDYKRYKRYSPKEDAAPKTSNKAIKQVKEFLKAPNLVQNLLGLFDSAGMPDAKLSLKLFIVSLSRLTEKPLHTILQGSLLLSDEVCKSFEQIIPEEGIRVATTLSPTALSNTPYPKYWHKKLLVVRQLEGALLKKGSTLEEYMTNDTVSRYVAEVNQSNGRYITGHKNLNDNFSVLGFTSKDFHGVFNSANVLCIPITNGKAIRKKLNEWELKQHAGIVDEDEIEKSILALKTIQRILEPVKVVNPYIDQIDFMNLFDNDVKKIRHFMQLTNLVTMLHQFQGAVKRKDKQLYYEVEAAHMLLVLELFKELWVQNYDELYFQVQGTLNRIKKTLIEQHSADELEDSMFTEKEINEALKMNPKTLNRHIKKLTLHNKLKRVFGNNRIGFHYAVVNWNELTVESDKYDTLKKELEQMRDSEVSQALKRAV